MTGHFKKLSSKAKHLLKNERGQGLVEYVLIIVLIGVALIAAMTTLKNQTSETFNKVGSTLVKGG